MDQTGKLGVPLVRPLIPSFLAKRSRHKFEQSVVEQLPTLYRVARRLTHNADDAEDLVSGAVQKALQNFESFDGRHLRSWLVAIMRNELLSDLRYRRRHPTEEFPEDWEPPTSDGWSEIAGRLEADCVLAALEAIPENYRLVVHMFDVEEMTYQEIAEALDIPLGTVRSRLSRGRQMIRHKLAGHIEVTR